jgi:hypothetical protein
VSNFYRATFTAAGSFTLPDVAGTTGTWSCPGNNFVEVNYAFGGFETQQWLAEANPAMKGPRVGRLPLFAEEDEERQLHGGRRRTRQQGLTGRLSNRL